MLHLHMNIRTGDALTIDPEGAAFETLEAARLEAIAAARQIMVDRILAGKPVDGSQFELSDATGSVVLVVPFEDAIRSLAPRTRSTASDQVA